MPTIRVKENDPFEVALRRFKRTIEKSGLLTELRARESTWIRNLPIKEDTILHFSFAAEGFKTLKRSVAYYDWFPSQSPSGNPLQKAMVMFMSDQMRQMQAEVRAVKDAIIQKDSASIKNAAKNTSKKSIKLFTKRPVCVIMYVA